MMATRAKRRLLRRFSALLERTRARAMRSFALYLAKPIEQFSLPAATDQQALAAVLRRGDVLLTAGNTRGAELVERLTQSRWSHVSMYVGALDDASDPLCVVEAHIASGVRAIRLSELDAHRVCVLRPVGLDDSDRGRLAESIVRYIGCDYDLAHAWLLARSLLLRRWWRRLRSVPTTMGRSASRFICSTLIAEAFALIGHAILPADAGARDREASLHSLVPADFERAPVFTIVWPVDVHDGCTSSR
ncbi:MAG TPA: YiiX/YebB-like N1pC/P60 family cysteine hydrolase [Casimicrobiaceae bacterium]|nr:YiiX/YebB-like N1pC/P60 family cysteine hydrolase [Casimicrobiaceae bacterium]